MDFRTSRPAFIADHTPQLSKLLNEVQGNVRGQTPFLFDRVMEVKESLSQLLHTNASFSPRVVDDGVLAECAQFLISVPVTPADVEPAPLAAPPTSKKKFRSEDVSFLPRKAHSYWAGVVEVVRKRTPSAWLVSWTPNYATLSLTTLAASPPS